MRHLGLGLLGLLLWALAARAEAPFIQPIPDWDVNEDAMLSVSVVITDPDSQNLLYWAESDNARLAVNFDEENMQIHCHPDANWFGRATVTVGVDDLDEARTLTTDEFVVNVLSVNDCPVPLPPSPLPRFTMSEDICLDISWDQLRAWFNDPDWSFGGDTLDFSDFAFNHGTVTTTATGIRLCPAANYNGLAQLALRASDGQCAINSSLSVRIAAVNDCPVQVTPWPAANGTEDTDLVLTGLLEAFSDVDGNSLSFCAQQDGLDGFEPEWNRSSTLTLHPPAELSGSWDLVLCVTDGTCTVNQTLHVTLEAVNDAPALPVVASLALDEDGSLIRSYPVTDVDSPEVFVTVASSDPALGVRWTANQGLTLTPQADWNGSATLTVTACDQAGGGGACSTAQIPVTVRPVNDAPVLAQPDDLSTDEDTSVAFAPQVSDIDSPTPALSIVCADPEVTATWLAGTGEYRFEAEPDWHGLCLATLTATDASGATASRQFTVVFVPVNDAPVQPAQQELELEEDGTLVWGWPVSDVDGPNLEVAVASSQPALTASWSNGLLTLAGHDDWFGAAQLTITACDNHDPELCVQRVLDVEVTPVNDAPAVVGLDDLSFPEDTIWEQGVVIDDVDSENLLVTVQSDTSALAVEWTDLDVLRLMPAADWNGTAQVTFIANDQAARSTASRTVSVTVQPVNDAPLAPAAAALEMDEDGQLTLDWPVSDVDGPALQVSVQSAAPALQASWQDGRLSLAAGGDWSGSTTLAVTVCDGAQPALCVERVLPVTVLPVNDAPVLTAPEVAFFPEDTWLALTLELADVDGPAPTLAVESLDGNLAASWNPESHELRLQGAPDWHGSAQVALGLCDGFPGGALCDLDTLDVTVVAQNDAPVVADPGDQQILEDGRLELALAISDIDNANLVVTAQSSAAQLSASWREADGVLVLQPAADWNGQATVVVRASDDAARLLGEAEFLVTVLPVNDAPVLTAPEVAVFPEDTWLALTLGLADVDGPAPTLAVESLDGNLTASWNPESHELRLQGAPDWHGSALVALGLCDGFPGGALCDLDTLEVTVVAQNDAPVVADPGDQQILEDGNLELALAISDIDNTTLVVTAQSDADELALVWREADEVLEIHPAADWNGQATVVVRASDDAARLLGQAEFLVTVLPVNDAPVITPLGDLQLAEDGVLEVACAASDVDGPELVLSAVADTSALTVSWVDGMLSLAGAADWFGVAHLTLRACDGFGDEPACVERTLEVTVGAVNDDPSIAPVADQQLAEDGSLVLPLVLGDVDGNELELAWSAEPAVLAISFDEEQSLLTLAGLPDWNGQCQVTLSLDDGQGRSVAVREFQVEVAPVNDAPYVLPCQDWGCGPVSDPVAFRQRLLDGELTVDLFDVDGDELELAWFVDGVEVASSVLPASADTVRCLALPAPPADLLEGEIVLHAELRDAQTALNPGGESCAWELDFTGIAVVHPTELALEPAWPNPFNPATCLPYALPVAGEATLAIYDMRGARVALLAEGWLPAGRHVARWDASGQASGVYVAVLEADGRRLVRRLTLLK